MNVFRGSLLKSSDQQIIKRTDSCSEPKLCINPAHLKLDVQPIHVQIAKTLLIEEEGMVSEDIFKGIPFLNKSSLVLNVSCHPPAPHNALLEGTVSEDDLLFLSKN